MRKLLNTVYVTDEQVYLSLDGENLLCKSEDEVRLRVPLENVENIVCFNYLGCSPALMGKCVSLSIPINFVSPSGKFLAKVCGETKGNVFLRVAQIDCFREHGLTLTQNTLAAKLCNTRALLRRSLHDNEKLREDPQVTETVRVLGESAENILSAQSVEEAMGIEGSCAREYFSVFDKLITNKDEAFTFSARSKRPPLDPVNAVLSFLYTLATSDYASALETVGLDSYIGFCHSLRSGRASLACDLVEETRCVVERLVLTMINLRILSPKDFTKQISGAIWLNDEGRKKVLEQWQTKKRSEIVHPYLKQKIPLGLLPYVQSNLLAKYIRGEIESYPPYLL